MVLALWVYAVRVRLGCVGVRGFGVCGCVLQYEGVFWECGGCLYEVWEVHAVFYIFTTAWVRGI